MTRLGGKHAILIVEDSDDDYEATVRAFKKNGNMANAIYRCESGEEALDFIFNRGPYANPEDAPRPGIILLDLNMPGVGGKEVLIELKKRSDFANIPVVVLTTSDDMRDVEECYQMGANTYIRKPVALDNFVEAIRRLKEYWFEIAILADKTGT